VAGKSKESWSEVFGQQTVGGSHPPPLLPHHSVASMSFVFVSSLVSPVPLFEPLAFLVVFLPVLSPVSTRLPDETELQAHLFAQEACIAPHYLPRRVLQVL